MTICVSEVQRKTGTELISNSIVARIWGRNTTPPHDGEQNTPRNSIADKFSPVEIWNVHQHSAFT